MLVFEIGVSPIANRNVLPPDLPWWKCDALHIDVRSRGALPGRESRITVLSNLKFSVHERKSAATGAWKAGIVMRVHEVQDPEDQFWRQDLKRSQRACLVCVLRLWIAEWFQIRRSWIQQ